MRALHCEQATWCPHGRNVTAIGSVVHIMHSFFPPPAAAAGCGLAATGSLGFDLFTDHRDSIY